MRKAENICVEELAGSLTGAWTFEEAGIVPGAGKGGILGMMSLPVAPKGWEPGKGWRLFYSSLAPEMKHGDVFRSSLGFSFVPCGMGIGLLPEESLLPDTGGSPKA